MVRHVALVLRGLLWQWWVTGSCLMVPGGCFGGGHGPWLPIQGKGLTHGVGLAVVGGGAVRPGWLCDGPTDHRA